MDRQFETVSCLTDQRTEQRVVDETPVASPEAGAGSKVLIRFVGGTPVGPLHIGHARHVVVGDCVARLLQAAGFEATREYSYDDTGAEMENLGRSMKMRYLQELGHCAIMPNGMFMGGHLVFIARELQQIQGQTWVVESSSKPFSDFAVQRILAMMGKEMESACVTMDAWTAESTLLRRRGIDDVRRRLFAANPTWKEVGVPRPLIIDLAYCEEAFERGFDRVVNVVDSHRGVDVERLRAGALSLGLEADRLEVISVQAPALIKGGKRSETRYSRREPPPISHAAKQLGVDALRFFLLQREAGVELDFDWELARSATTDNPLHQVQSAHACCVQLLDDAARRGIEWNGAEEESRELPALEEEHGLMSKIVQHARVVQSAATDLAPHAVAEYLGDLAGTALSRFSPDSDNPAEGFIGPDDAPQCRARAKLVAASRTVLSNGLGLLGVSTGEQVG